MVPASSTTTLSAVSEKTDHPVIEPAEFRRVLGHFPTGVTVVTAIADDEPVGVAIGSFVSISLDPPLVGFFIGNESTSAPGVRRAGAFCVNVLARNQLELCGAMASKADDKFSGWQWIPAPATGSPTFGGVHAFIDCELVDIVEVGDHDLFVGRVLALDTVDDEPPMVFYRGQYGSFGTGA